MPLSLQKTKAIAEMSSLLYDFLPGEPYPFADQNISFVGIANKLGLSYFWTLGNKGIAISNLLM
ncbi:MAG: hypothetical protein ACFFDI_01440 [Promethearchaeota archaeon]